VVLTAETASAIPAFARKYQTSCHTCHIAYPKLNSFGNAFRLRGYRMPAETEDMIKEEPVPLGVDAYKRVWPDAIWPSDIPGTVPLSVDVRVASVTQHDAETEETIKNDFRFPEEVELLAGGTLGETLSFFTGLGFEVETEHGQTEIDVEIGHAELRFNGPLGSGTAFNAKFGRLSPEITQAFNHGYLLTESMPAAMFGFNPIGFHGSTEVAGLGHAGGHGGGGGGISLPPSIDGIEVYGIVGHRFEYSGGISNGIGPGDATRDANGSKDVFGRIGYKIGGLSLDGEEGLQNEKNWRENSLRVGLFGYRGDGGDILFQGTGHHASSFAEDEEFTRVGGDVNFYLRDLNVIFGFVRGRDRLAVFDIPEDEHGEDEHAEDEHAEDEHAETDELVLRSGFPDDFTYKAWFAEADYVFYPWLHGAFRYEWLDPSRPGSDKFERVTANGTVLVRANVKALVEWQRNIGGDAQDDYAVRAALRFAF
jgi:hypothetical protein